jgi:integrator complex subunit 2
MPGLAVALTLEMNKEYTQSGKDRVQEDSNTDIVGFVSGMLLGNDTRVKEWFAQYVKVGQKVNM